MPYGSDFLEIEFDFVHHQLLFRTSTGLAASTPLRAQSVAAFYAEFQKTLSDLGVHVDIWATPVELAHPIPFAEDTQHASYDPEYAHRFWRILIQSDQVFQQFSSRFIGKISPVHFFWGSFDLAVTRFSGRPAPPREGADPITREAYSHEVISAGFWPGNGGYGKAAFYCYAAPSPANLDTAAPSHSSLLGSRPRRIHPPLRRSPLLLIPRGNPALLPAEHLCRSRQPRSLGSQRVRAANGLA